MDRVSPIRPPHLPHTLYAQVYILGIISVVLVAVTVPLLMFNVKERLESDVSTAASFVPSIRDLLHNGPYVNYLMIKLCLTLAGHLPRSVSLYYIKYYIKYENSILVFNLFMLECIIVSGLVMQPTVKLMMRFGKKELIVLTCIGEVTVFSLFALIPVHVIKAYNLLFLFGFFVAVSSVSANLIPEAILADIIDYDELHSGSRRSGVYVVLETNIMQVRHTTPPAYQPHHTPPPAYQPTVHVTHRRIIRIIAEIACECRRRSSI